MLLLIHLCGIELMYAIIISIMEGNILIALFISVLVVNMAFIASVVREQYRKEREGIDKDNS